MVQSGEWINGIQGGQDPGTFVRSLTAKTSHVIHLHVLQSLHDIIRGKAEACNFKLFLQDPKDQQRSVADHEMCSDPLLQLVKDHIAVSLSIQPEDLDLSPFDRRGGLGRFYQVFGDKYEEILREMNRELVA